MEPFDRDRRKKNPFDDFFNNLDDEDFEKIFDEARRMMEEMFKTGVPFKSFEEGKPFIHGFKINMGSNGKPQISEFGNRQTKTPEGEPTMSEEVEPLTDIIEADNDVSITVELPGVERDDIDLNVTDNALEIKVDTPQRKYQKTLDLPCDVKPKTTKATYKNGILDVVINRKEKKKDGTGYKINIE